MPADDSLGLHQDEGRPPARPRAGQQDPGHPIARAETRPRGALRGPQLLSQGHVLEHEVVTSAAGHGDRAADQQNQFEHGEIVASVIRQINRVDDGWSSGERHLPASHQPMSS